MKHTNISEWPKAERPREKLLARGSAALSDAELLAIFIRCGVKGKTAVDVARELLQRFGNLKILLDLDCKKFCACCGLGVAKYAELQASLELVRRYVAQTFNNSGLISDVTTTKLYCATKLGQHKREVFAVMFLDNNHQIIYYDEMFFGTINRATVYPREVARKALHHNASAVVLLHNHIAGSALPSKDDRQVTLQLQKVLMLIDVKVLDHIIVGSGECFSFAENQELQL